METYLIIDSRDRDRAHATTPAAYTYALDDPLRAVESAQLVNAVYPPSPDPELYVSLMIDELLPTSTWSKNHSLRESFAQLPLLDASSRDATTFRGPQEYPKALGKIGKLTIRFVRHDGTSFAPMPEHLLVIRVVRQVPRLLTDDVSLRALGLAPGYTAEDLGRAYVTAKAERVRTGAHASELFMLKAAYKDLLRRLESS